MSLELKLDLENEVSFDFKEGRLLLLFPDQAEKNQRKPTEMSRLQFGRATQPEAIRGSFVYFIELKDLKRIKNGYPLRFIELNTLTEGRRTLTGGLHLKRKTQQSYFITSRHFLDTKPIFEEARFSRREYKIIKQYL